MSNFTFPCKLKKIITDRFHRKARPLVIDFVALVLFEQAENPSISWNIIINTSSIALVVQNFPKIDILVADYDFSVACDFEVTVDDSKV
jgi:hypothetical protein